jgi:hypothetical protein
LTRECRTHFARQIAGYRIGTGKFVPRKSLTSRMSASWVHGN